MKLLLAATLCFLQFVATAQDSVQVLDYKKAITISPLALGDIDNGLMLGAEYRFNPRMALLLDASYLFGSYYFGVRPERVSGFTVRPSMRFYTGKKEKKSFVQVQSFYKQVNYTLHDWLDKNLVNNVPAYSQLQNFTYQKEVWGINFMGGFLKSFSSDRLFLDFAGGLGVRFKKQGVTEPNSRFRQTWGLGSAFENNVTTLSFPLSLKLGYRLK